MARKTSEIDFSGPFGAQNGGKRVEHSLVVAGLKCFKVVLTVLTGFNWF